jgi:hypothetical protein
LLDLEQLDLTPEKTRYATRNGRRAPSRPDEVRRIFTHNGVAVLANLQGEWLRLDTALLAAIDQPVLLVAATDSPPEVPRPERSDGSGASQRWSGADGRRTPDQPRGT